METLAISNGKKSTAANEETGKQLERTPLDDHQRYQIKGQQWQRRKHQLENPEGKENGVWIPKH